MRQAHFLFLCVYLNDAGLEAEPKTPIKYDIHYKTKAAPAFLGCELYSVYLKIT